jgi:hypothetical protein
MGQNLKPDLVTVNLGSVHVVDVTVRHEDIGYLEDSKVEKYTTVMDILATHLKVQPGKVLPIVIGTRGCIPESILYSLCDLNINDRGLLYHINF